MNEIDNLDVHALARCRAACGFDDEVVLSSREVAGLARRLRAIGAIASLLSTDDADFVGGLTLGGLLRHGLIEAVDMLAGDAEAVLAQANEDLGTGVGPSFEWPAQRPEKHGPPCIFDDMLAKSQEAEKWATQGGAA